jgi:RNA-binding protein YhbY
MRSNQAVVQIGKNGFTSGTIVIIKNCFKTHNDVKVSLLKSAGHDKETVKEIAEKIVEELGKKYTYRIVGFTIFLKKWRKERK